MTNDERSIAQFRLIFSTVIIASFLAYLSARQFFISHFGMIEHWLLGAVGVSAICSFIFIYLNAVEAKFFKSRFLLTPRPEDKKIFFDLSVDVFLLVPILFAYSYLNDFLLSEMPRDASTAQYITGVVILILFLVVVPAIFRLIAKFLRYMMYSSEDFKRQFSPREDRIITFFIGILVLNFVTPTEPSSALNDARLPVGIVFGALWLGYLTFVTIKHIRSEADKKPQQDDSQSNSKSKV